MTAVRARRSHRAQPRRARRRRWPIVTTSLVVLLAVVIGGGYAAWRWSQDQYYVGADSKGQVVIYSGVNQRILGISLSHPYQQTQIQLAQVPAPYQATVKATDAASNLSGARAIVANVQHAVNACKQAYLDRQAWVARENLFKAYKAAVVVASKQHKKPPAAVADPGAEPPLSGAMCPPSTAFGIAAADLNPAKAS
jgi:protein phosphatase